MSRPFTVGDLRNALKAFDDGTPLQFHGGLTFNSVRPDSSVGDVLIEFAELEADLAEETRQTILVAFCRREPMDGATGLTIVPRL